ncbi:sensor histidine kinase [Candidatus Sulfurimonas baltica]|uniref:histidine kinase n=1 Tax=Candidatus Sulfurimonas baltica TaxID=2740404 RepID=A0A7S7LU17_9BACT|nr:ATP-binding protein [Candidatus Sulfurimonas baltica]QOY51307.1 hypothetical protein HUE88_09235 [Candidatus Sulfurimonas baltica]
MSTNTFKYQFLLVLAFLVSFFIVFFVLTNDKKQRVKEHLRQTISANQMNYDTNLRLYKKIAQHTFDLIVQEPDILNILEEALNADDIRRGVLREKLYDLTKGDYAKLVKLGVLQFQFVFPNSQNFLRTHKHEKFGDDLKGIRYSFDYVNKHKEFIEGFEGGRTIHAYRFVYPVFSSKNIYLGAVEISFSSGALQKSIEENHKTHTHFIVNKKLFDTNLWKPEIFNKYLQSLEHEDYLYTVTSKLDIEEARKKEKAIIDKYMKKDIEKNFKHEKSFALCHEFDDSVQVVTFIPVRHTDNKSVVAYFVSYAMNDELKNIISDYKHINAIIAIALMVLFYFLYRILKSNINIKIAQKETKSIINFLPSIIILYRNKNIIEVNLKFLMFFNQYKDLEEFLNQYECVCDLFEVHDDKNYIQSKYINGVYWTDYIKNKDKVHKAMIIKDGKEYHFAVKAREVIYQNETTDIIQLIDITNEVELNNSVKDKEKQLFQQAKMASMGEMIGNIAHQWRQPLNIISVMNMKVEFMLELNGSVSYEDYKPMSEAIAGQLEYMTKTIDDFRSYYNPNKLKENFCVKQSIQDVYNLITPQLNSHSITLSIIDDSSDEELILYGYANEFKQVIINIVNNSKDAILQCQNSDKEKVGHIEIKIKKINDEIIIAIEDNGDGIPLDIIDKIYEPYFTTKHKSKGTGLGLNMSHQIITDHMNGTIVVYNSTENNHDKGAIFIITLPVNKNNNVS